MLIALIVIGVVVLILIMWFIGSYNSFVKLRNTVREAFSTMDVYLKKRWDLIPNLVETVKGYATHEKETLERVTALRNSAYDQMSPADKIAANQDLTGALSRLLMLQENYPDLKANQNFMDLSGQLKKIEEDIANSRKYYNAVVKNLNNKVQMFPSNIIAGMFRFTEEKMFEVSSEAERENVKVEF